MKWEPADLRVGAAVLAALAILAAAAIWLTGTAGDRRAVLYAEFTRVDGISAHTPVQLGGFTVGRVETIEPHADAAGALSFRVTMRVELRLPSGARLPLSAGTRARLVPPPVTVAGNLLAGVVELEPGPAGATPLLSGATVPGEAVAPALDQAQALAVSLGDDVRRTLSALRAVSDSLALASRTVQHSSAAVERSAVATGRAMPEMARSVRTELAAADTLIRDARGMTSALAALAPGASAGIDSARAAFGASRRLAGDASAALATRDAELGRVLARLDTTSALLNNFVRAVSRNPVRALTGVRPARADAPPRATTRSPVAASLAPASPDSSALRP